MPGAPRLGPEAGCAHQLLSPRKSPSGDSTMPWSRWPRLTGLETRGTHTGPNAQGSTILFCFFSRAQQTRPPKACYNFCSRVSGLPHATRRLLVRAVQPASAGGPRPAEAGLGGGPRGRGERAERPGGTIGYFRGPARPPLPPPMLDVAIPEGWHEHSATPATSLGARCGYSRGLARARGTGA